MDVSDNPWEPSRDVFAACLSNDWTVLVSRAVDPCGYHTMNILGDLSGVHDLTGLLVDVLLPAMLSKTNGCESGQVLLMSLANKATELRRLVDIMFAEVINELEDSGLISQATVCRKWDWWPFVSRCHDGKNGDPVASLSSLAMTHNTAVVSPIVFVLRCLIHTIIEDDIQSRISPWFESHKAYWKLLTEWLEAFYEILGAWQQSHDKKGVWNQPHGKLFRAIRPFSTHVPCMSLVLMRNGTMDKSGILRIVLYHTIMFTRILRAWNRQLIGWGGISARADDLEASTDNFIRVLSSVGITRVGWLPSILWGDKHLPTVVPMPPALEGCGRPQNEAVRFGEMKNFAATVAYQRNLCLQMLMEAFAFTEIFKAPLDEFIRSNRSVYESIMTMEIPEPPPIPAP